MQKDEITTYLRNLRETIIDAFQSLEKDKQFKRTSWTYTKGEGGGEMAVLRGDVFEKAAVNFSAVAGSTFPGDDGKGPFFATGVSLITHLQNPYAPTVHMNIRYIETPDRFWFGGGYDLTPMGFPFEEDTNHFHGVAKKTLAPFGRYDEFFSNAKIYFTIPHRQKERGVGGIFFDHFNTGDLSRDLALWKGVGDTFLEAIMPIYERRIPMSYTEKEKETQYQLRGHYAEFNLAYDRGTKFGFLSGGNPEAILCSMPPVAKW